MQSFRCLSTVLRSTLRSQTSTLSAYSDIAPRWARNAQSFSPKTLPQTCLRPRLFSSIPALQLQADNSTTKSSTAALSQSQSSQSKASTLTSATKSTRDDPAYEMTFTCKICQTRSSHRVSKHGYHKGTVLIKCDGCKNRHLISDHLRIFKDASTTMETILREQGEKIQRGSIDGSGHIELWKDQ